MTYKKAIERVNQKVRDERAWPDGNTKKAEQLHLLHNAVIAVARNVPLSRLPTSESDKIGSARRVIGDLHEYALPEDVFYYRDDLGISHFILDEDSLYRYDAVMAPVARQMAANPLYRWQVFFAVDPSARKVFAHGVSELKISNFPLPAAPEQLDDTFPPLTGNDFELVCSIVAAHVSGETIRDQGQVSFQSFLSQLYGEPQPPEQ